MRLISILALSGFLAVGSPALPSLANGNEAVNALKVDIAGRQRMLTQRIAKSACFLSAFHKIEKHKAMLRDARDLFDKSLAALKNGDPLMGLPPETDAVIIDELSKVDEPWRALDFASELLLGSYQFPGLDVDMIMANNLPALKQSNLVVQVMDNTFSRTEAKDNGLVTTVNVAGRQRMLTQKSAKEFCMITYRQDDASQRESLRATVALFDQSIDDLANGSEQRGIIAAPTPEIVAKVAAVKAKWQQSRQVFMKVAGGAFPTSDDFEVISSSNDLLLKESNNIVQMLVAYSKVQDSTTPDVLDAQPDT